MNVDAEALADEGDFVGEGDVDVSVGVLGDLGGFCCQAGGGIQLCLGDVLVECEAASSAFRGEPSHDSWHGGQVV